ncbi:pitrilysin family protein [Granulicella sp. dw_53]|uniref:M16 family metallopeptidase n=1 Tax=Granulicella sp. dw_53 TaxID=2719792 RepID=UPI001BD47C5D|nr:pitrilysin family protein [Granulicella sp. dw_53]
MPSYTSKLADLTIHGILTSALAFASVSSLAQPLPPAKPLKLPELKYEKFTLPNGLVVITHEDHRLPLVAVDLWYHVGPLNERAGRTGFAHLFEHMMFEGSEHVGEKAHIKYVQGAGATDVNGTTSFDRTNYFETVPSNQFELALWLESDRMGFLLEGLDREKLTNQRDVVRNERRQGEGSPYELASEQVYHLLFPKEHPYYAAVIGSHADIEAARINDIRDFHQQFYTPNNASLAIAGDFNPATLKALLTKYFGPIPHGPKVDPVTATTPAINEQKRATVTDTVKLPQLRIAFLTPPAYAPGDADAALAAYILGGAKASRLDQKFVYQQQTAQSVSCSHDPLKLTSVLECTITAKPGIELKDLEATFWQEVGRLQSDGPTQDELDSARTIEVTRKISGLQRLGGFGGIADTLNSYNQYQGDPGYLPKDIARYQAATIASVKQAAKQFLDQNHAVVVSCIPGKKVVDDVPRSPATTDAEVKLTQPYTADFEAAQNWRKTAPAPGPALTFHLPVPKTFTLKNGLKVLLVEDSNLPVLSATVVSRSGGETNPTTRPGLATFTAAMLSEGTTKRSSTQLAEDSERIGTRLAALSSMDGTSTSVSVLTNNTDAAMDLLSDVVLHPAFNPTDLERIRHQRMVSIQQEGDQPPAIAQRVGPRLVYGDQPYGFATSGTVDSVKAITREQMLAFWSQHYGPKDSALVLAGDLKEPEARSLAERYFGSWTGAAASAISLPPAPPAPKLRLVLVDKPGSPQTALFAFGIGVPRSTPNLEALQVMNYTLGGSFASRINMNLREVHGYTYGAQSIYTLYREGGPFLAGGLVKTDVTAPAAKELMLEINRIQTEPPTPAELKMAKDARVQSIPAQFETTAATAAAMTSIFLYNRPLDYYATLPDAYRAVTTEAVVAAAKTDVHPDHLILVAVGDRTKIEPGLKDLNLAPIEYSDTSGNIIK